jgi:hypothetical protein
MACTEIYNPWQYLPWDNLVLSRINKYTLFFTSLSPPHPLSYQFQHCILLIPFCQKFFFCGAHRIHRGHAGSLAHEMVWNYSIYMHIDFDKGCRKKNCQLLPNTRLSVRKILGKILGREPRICPTFMEFPAPPPPQIVFVLYIVQQYTGRFPSGFQYLLKKLVLKTPCYQLNNGPWLCSVIRYGTLGALKSLRASARSLVL